MNRIIGLGRTTLFLALVAGWLTAVANVAMAQEQSANAVETTTGPAYLMPYSVVVITIGVTIFLVVRPSRRRVRHRPANSRRWCTVCGPTAKARRPSRWA